MSEYVELLRQQPHYRNLWLARMVSNLGDWFNLLASAQLIASLTESGTAVSLLFLSRFLPIFFATPFAGVFADRFSRRWIMVVADLLRAATVLCFLLVRDAGDIWLFYALTAVQFTLSALYNPAHSAIIANVVPQEKLLAANTLDSVTWSTMLAVGALLGGVAAALLGVQAAFVIDASSFVLAAMLVARVRPVYADPVRHESRGGHLDFVDGLRYLQRRPFLFGIALVKAGGSLIWGAINVLEIPLANDIFPLNGSGTLTLGLIYALVGVGTGLGPVLMRRWKGDGVPALLMGIGAGFGLLIVGAFGIGLSPTLWGVLVAITLRAMGSGVLWVYSAALLQSSVQDHFRGRVFAFEFAAATLMESAGTIYGGVALDRFGWGPQQAMVAAGAGGLAVMALWLIFRWRVPVSIAWGGAQHAAPALAEGAADEAGRAVEEVV